MCTMSGPGGRTPHIITLYTYNDKQFTETNSFKLQFISFYDITIGLGNDGIYIANPSEHCIYVFSLDGTVLTKQGRYGGGGSGELKNPFAASTDAQDNLLVCDIGNNRLQVMTRKGKWRLLQRDEENEGPWDAVVVDDKVFVVCGFDKNYLCVYDII